MSDEYRPDVAGQADSERRQGGSTAGIVLIVIGAVLLAAQFMPGLVWWAAWPLIIVIAGVIQAVMPSKTGWSWLKMLDGLVTVTIGLALLAWTTGRLGGGFLGTLLSMWPVLIIAIGFDLMSKALHAPALKALGSLAVIAAVVFAVVVSAGGAGGYAFEQRGEESFDFSEPVDDVEEASLKLSAGVAGVRIRDGSDLLAAEGSSPFGEPVFEVDRSGSEADVELSLGGGGPTFPGMGDAEMDARLSGEVLWDLLIGTGVSELDADLSGLQLRSLELKPGIASCTVKIGEVPEEVDQGTIDVKAGISSVRLQLPEGVEARVVSDSGLTGHDIGGDFESTGSGTWETPGYDSARDGSWLIRIQSGIGSIEVDTYE